MQKTQHHYGDSRAQNAQTTANPEPSRSSIQCYRCLRNKRPSKPYELIRFGAMDVTKPYELIGFGAMDVTKPYELLGFWAMDFTKPYELIGFGAIDVTKPYELIGFGAMGGGAWGAKPPTFCNGCWGRWGRPDPKNRPNKFRPDCLQVPSFMFILAPRSRGGVRTASVPRTSAVLA